MNPFQWINEVVTVIYCFILRLKFVRFTYTFYVPELTFVLYLMIWKIKFLLIYWIVNILEG